MQRKLFNLITINGVFKLLYGDNKKSLIYKNSFINTFKQSKPKPKSDFIALWTTDENNKVVLPIEEPSNLIIDWGDGTINEEVEHIYTTAGNYTIRIKGAFSFNNVLDGNTQLTDVLDWGEYVLKHNVLTLKFPDINLEAVQGVPVIETTNFNKLFNKYKYTTINGLNDWDTSRVTDMSEMFSNAQRFNQPLKFNTSSVTNMSNFLYWAGNFNQVIELNTRNVTNMSSMLSGLFKFNQPLNFDTSSVTNMSQMFYYTTEFNYPLNFDTKNVTNMSGMFRDMIMFNSEVNFTDTSKVTDMSDMFNNTPSFNKPLNFDTSSVENMSQMFIRAQRFNSPINFTDTSKVTNMYGMFYFATSFNQPVNFDTRSVNDMESMFYSAEAFNQPLRFSNASKPNIGTMFFNAYAMTYQVEWYQ